MRLRSRILHFSI